MDLSRTKIFIILILLAISGFISFVIDFMHIDVNPSYVRFGLDILLLFATIFSFNIKNSKSLLILIVMFLIISLVSLFININDLEFVYFINGLRDFMPYFLFPVLYINIFQSCNASILRKYMNIFLYIFLIIQIPVSLLQYFAEGAGDTVGGTLGAGGSGILSFTVYLSTFYLMIQDFDQKYYFRNIIKKSYLLIFWLPSFINETKISFLLMIAFFFLLVPLNMKSLFKIILICLLLIPGELLFERIYTSTTGSSYFNEILQEDYLNNYMIGVDNMNFSEGLDIPRLTKISLAIEIQKGEKFLFGNGIGQFKGGTTLPLTTFATNYQWLLEGSVPLLFFIFIQLGCSGVLIFMIFWYFLFNCSWQNKLFNYSRNLGLLCTISFLIIMFYNDSLRSLFFCGLIMYFFVFAGYWKDGKRVINN